LELKDIDAVVELKDGQHVTIKSINGVYDTEGDLLRLNDHITLNSTSGYEGLLSEATVNMANGNIVSESPAEMKLPNGVFNANRPEVMENGALILFGGGVEVTLNPDQMRPAPQDFVPPGAPRKFRFWGRHPILRFPGRTWAEPVEKKGLRQTAM
jgi:hypothetical protein